MFFAKKPGKDLWQKYISLGLGNKKTGKYAKNPYVNYKMEDGKVAGMFINTVEWQYGHDEPPLETIRNYINYVDPEENITAESRILSQDPTEGCYVTFIPKEFHHYPFVIEAKEKELKNFNKFLVYEEVDDVGQNYITSGWVVTEKWIEGEQRCKARLVVHGNQLVEEIRTDSPTVRKASLRIQFFLAAQYQWKVKTADVASAFLQAGPLQRDIFV